MAVKKRAMTDIFLYRKRYILGYSFLTLLYIGAVIMAAIYAPGGLTQAEIDSLSTTNSLGFNLNSVATANLPFHLLQLLFFKLFGVSILTIKAPAVIFSIIAFFAIFFLLRRWFKPGITILSLLIMTTTAQFLFIGQNATPDILYIAYTALILLFATLIIQRADHHNIWHNALAVVIVASLFTPYFWYINLGLLLIALLHPHPRHFLISRKYRLRWLSPIAITALGIAFIAALCLINPNFANNIIGVKLLNFNIPNNTATLLSSYFALTPSVIYNHITPIMDMATIFIMTLGFARSIQQRHQARSFMIWSWLILATALLILQPSLTPIIIVPLFIVLAIGIETLLNEWYRLFPKNPYARGTGLLFISSLIAIMIIGGGLRYVDSYRYYPLAANQFNTDIRKLKNALGNGPATLLVDAKEKPLYDALSRHSHQNITVLETLPGNFSGDIYVSRQARQQVSINDDDLKLKSIIVNDRAEAGDRFYLYTISQK